MSSGDREALRLADECANFDASIYRDVAHANAGMLAQLQYAADEIRRLVAARAECERQYQAKTEEFIGLLAEREADLAVMREALEALEKEKRPWDQPVRDAAISSLKARTQ